MFFFAVLRRNIPGRAEKNEPKTPDVGSDGASISAWRNGWGLPEAML